MKGKVKWYNIKQGYGFITGEDGKEVFIHKNEIPFWSIFLKSGDNVEYLIRETKRGIEAKEVTMI
jgi:CspA family cold shock protein